MMKAKHNFKSIVKAIGIMLLMLGFSSTASAAWYKAQVVSIVAVGSTGDSVVIFTPAPGETGFTGQARGLVLNSETGGNKVLNGIMAAMLLKLQVNLRFDNAAPTFSNPQVIDAVSVVSN